jgi:hypothetical protein
MIGAVLVWFPSAAHAGNRNPRVIPPQTTAYGGYSQLAAAWWQWILQTPGSTSPLSDTNGEFAAVNQSGPVWFLAGNSGGTSERTVTVPAGKALFFPVLNAFDTEDGTVPEMRAGLAALIDTASDMDVEIDGKSIGNLTSYREQSVEFAIDLPADNIFGDPTLAGHYEPVVDDGIYLLVAPLRVGAHTIHFHGTTTLTGFTLDVTYHLTVAPSE